jgi:O-antigen/teichoic acid export membrane protein
VQAIATSIGEKVRQAVRSRLLREVAVTYSGQLVASGIGFVIQLLLQKQLGPSDYGAYGTAVSAAAITGVLTDVGLSHAMVRFGSRALADHPDERSKAMAHFASAFFLRLSLAGVVSLVGFLSARWAALHYYHNADMERPLAWVYLGLAGSTLYSFWQFYIQTFQRFGMRSVVVVTASVLRFGLFATVWWLGLLSPVAMVMVDMAVNLLGFIIGMSLAPKGLLKVDRAQMRKALDDLLPYCKFTGILIIGDTLFNELDTQMLAHYRDDQTTGLYRAALTYAMVLGFLNLSVSNVLFPKVTSVSDTRQLRDFMKQIVKFTGMLAVLTLPAVPFLSWWIPWYERQYATATTMFYIMYVGLVFELIFGPLQYVIYSLDRPEVLAFTAILKIALNFVGNLALIPRYGAYGAAAATVVTRLLGGLLVVAVIFRTLRQRERATSTAN